MSVGSRLEFLLCSRLPGIERARACLAAGGLERDVESRDEEMTSYLNRSAKEEECLDNCGEMAKYRVYHVEGQTLVARL